MKKRAFCAIIAFFVLTLSACSFHLRRNPVYLADQYPIIVLPFTGSHTLHQALFRALTSASIHVVDTCPPDGNAPRLIVVDQNLTQRPLVYGEDSELRRERLIMTITFSFGETNPKEFTLSTQRDHQLNSNQHLGDNAEKIIIEREMQLDIIDQLLRYIDMENFENPPF